MEQNELFAGTFLEDEEVRRRCLHFKTVESLLFICEKKDFSSVSDEPPEENDYYLGDMSLLEKSVWTLMLEAKGKFHKEFLTLLKKLLEERFAESILEQHNSIEIYLGDKVYSCYVDPSKSCKEVSVVGVTLGLVFDFDIYPKDLN